MDMADCKNIEDSYHHAPSLHPFNSEEDILLN